MCQRTLSGTEHLHENWNILQEYPLSKSMLAVSHVWKDPNKEDYIIAAKGAPESIADLCHLNSTDLEKVNIAILKMASDGLRVIGVAKAEMNQDPLPSEQHDFNFEFLGLLGFEDPVRPSVKDAIKECYSAGIRVIMITGDYPETARSIAKQIGLKNPNEAITGPELNKIGRSAS